jgi:hypothetical protein
MQAINAINLNKSTSIPCMKRLLNYTHGDTTLIGIIEKRHLKVQLIMHLVTMPCMARALQDDQYTCRLGRYDYVNYVTITCIVLHSSHAKNEIRLFHTPSILVTQMIQNNDLRSTVRIQVKTHYYTRSDNMNVKYSRSSALTQEGSTYNQSLYFVYIVAILSRMDEKIDLCDSFFRSIHSAQVPLVQIIGCLC